MDEEIPECNGPTMVLTMLHKCDEPFSVLGAVGEQEFVETGGANGDANLFAFPEEPNVPAELMESSKPEEVGQVDPRGSGVETAPVFEWQFANKDTLMVNEEILTIDSSINLLRAAAEFLGVSKNGSKETLWSRLNQRAQTLEHEQLFLDSNKIYKDEQWRQGLVGQSIPRTPSEE